MASGAQPGPAERVGAVIVAAANQIRGSLRGPLGTLLNIGRKRDDDRPITQTSAPSKPAAGAESELRSIAERLSAPVATTISGKGSIDEHHPLAAGVVGSNGGTPETRAIVDQAAETGGREHDIEYRVLPSGRGNPPVGAGGPVASAWTLTPVKRSLVTVPAAFSASILADTVMPSVCEMFDDMARWSVK